METRSATRVRRVRLVVPFVLVAAASLVLVGTSSAKQAALAKHPGEREVTLGFDKAEPGRLVGEGLPVLRTNHPWRGKAKTIYSVRMPRMRPRQQLAVRGTVAVSRCNESDQRPGGGAHQGTLHSPCESVRDPYSVPGGGTYEPRIAVRVYLSEHRSDLTHGLGHWEVHRCTTGLHHCFFNLRASLSHVPNRQGMSLDLVAMAFSPKARLGEQRHPVDVVELDGDCKGHDFDPCEPVLKSASSNTQGALTAIRFGATRKPARPRTTTRLVNHQVRVQASGRVTSATRPRVILREKLRNLSAGDVVDARASFHLRAHGVGGYVFRHEVSGLLFMSPDPSAVQPGSRGRWIAPSARTNCPHPSGCRIEKIGAATVPKSAPKTMWVIYAGSARDSGGRNGAPADVTRGSLSVAVDQADDR